MTNYAIDIFSVTIVFLLLFVERVSSSTFNYLSIEKANSSQPKLNISQRKKAKILIIYNIAILCYEVVLALIYKNAIIDISYRYTISLDIIEPSASMVVLLFSSILILIVFNVSLIYKLGSRLIKLYRMSIK